MGTHESLVPATIAGPGGDDAEARVDGLDPAATLAGAPGDDGADDPGAEDAAFATRLPTPRAEPPAPPPGDPAEDFAATRPFAVDPAAAPEAPAAADPGATMDLAATEAIPATVAPAPRAIPADDLAETAFETRPHSGAEPPPGPARRPDADAAAAADASRFRVLRPHAKGGLGEVFVALDGELSREVALKEIQLRHAHNEESRSRFLLEAEVTGGLEHPGIVPVYGLGAYSDGRPFYAMRFIRGESLEEAIRAFHDAEGPGRDPGDRELALRQLLARFIAVCDAIAYAHSRGVLHRDLKPANVMLGPFGETLVVDWGLAKALGRSEEVDADRGVLPLRPLSGAGNSETLFGSTIGTPHFMSPEQAAGRLDLMGPTGDVYSLGATLYVLLAGRTPFTEKTLLKLLEKVKSGEFPPPRAVNRKVPAALSAICLKAMALKPEDRYPSARALAADLEHWLADEPVSAHREPPAARLRRWARRHRTLVATAGALLATAVLALGVGTVLIKQEQARTEANFRLARDAVDQMLTELGEVELADVPQMEPVRKKMLGKALDFYQTFLRQRGDDRSIRREVARANLRLGDILDMLGDTAGAEPAYDRAIALLADLSAADPARTGYRQDLARSYHNLGVLLKKSSRYAESEKALRAALRLRKALVAAEPGRDDLLREEKNTVYHLGAVLARLPGKVERARADYDEAIGTQRQLVARERGRPEDRRFLGRYLNNLGMLLNTRDPREAEGTFREALALQRALIAESPTVAGIRWELGRTLSNLGTALDLRHRDDEAAATYREALGQFKGLADDYPAVPDYRHELSAVHGNLARIFDRIGPREDRAAEEHLAAALGLQRALAAAFPKRPDYRLRLAETLRKRARPLARLGRPDEAEGMLREALAISERLAEDYPGAPEYRAALGLVANNLGGVLASRGKRDEARRALEEATRHHRIALDADDRNALALGSLVADHDSLAKLLATTGDPAGAAKATEEMARLAPDDPHALCLAARDLTLCVKAAQGDSTRADAYGRRAVELLGRAVKSGKIGAPELLQPGYDPIRNRPDFQALRLHVESRANPPLG